MNSNCNSDAQTESARADSVQRSFMPPPAGEYIYVDEDEGTAYPITLMNGEWLSEKEAEDMLKELTACLEWLKGRRHNARADLPPASDAARDSGTEAANGG